MKENSILLYSTKIYLVTNCYGDPNKVYIGKTKNCRFINHKTTYGNEITYDYIDEIDSLDKKDWKPLECFWIEQFKQWGFDVINKNNGGGGPSFFTEESKLKLSKSRLGFKHNEFTKEKMSKIHKGKPKPFDENHKINHKNSYQTMDRTWIDDKWKNNISKGLKGRKVTWDTSGGKECLRKKVNQYDLEGNFIKEWESISEASKYVKGDINSFLKGKQKQAGGFIWKYA